MSTLRERIYEAADQANAPLRRPSLRQWWREWYPVKPRFLRISYYGRIFVDARHLAREWARKHGGLR